MANKSWTEHFRLITPVLVLVSGVITGAFGWSIQRNIANSDARIANVELSVKGIDEKMFTHLTNHDLHTAPSLIVSKAEFSLYQQMRDKQMGDLKDMMFEIRSLLEKHMEKK